MMCVVEWCSHDLGESASHDSSVYLFYKLLARALSSVLGTHASMAANISKQPFHGTPHR